METEQGSLERLAAAALSGISWKGKKKKRQMFVALNLYTIKILIKKKKSWNSLFIVQRTKKKKSHGYENW